MDRSLDRLLIQSRGSFRPMKNETVLVIGGLFLRIIISIYGYLQDQTAFKFTDIDYLVFTDASKMDNPYSRSTYRYTPLLAWILYPERFIPMFGKLLFCTCDLLVGMLMYRLMKSQTVPIVTAKNRIVKTTRSVAEDRLEKSFLLTGILWAWNPFVAIISCRGNSESILSLLVIATLYLYHKRRFDLAAIVFGLSVHFKLYPVIYAIPIWFGISETWIDFQKLRFGALSFSVFMALNLVMYSYYNEFLHEAILYHFKRQDHRHNFSIYFLHIYLGFNA